MPAPLRVLIVEDQPSDAELMVHELRRSGFETDWKRVDMEADYLAQLEQSPDIILADHTLPQFSAPRALELLLGQRLDIPFIVVAGSISEEVAVRIIKQGAADYILKDRMARLGEAVRRALEDKRLRDEKRRAEEETQKNLERIRALHEIDLAIASTLDLRTVLDFFLDKIGLFLPQASAATIRLWNKRSGLLEPVACRNLNEAVWMATESKDGLGLCPVVFETRNILIAPNVQTDPRVRDREFVHRYGLVSYVGVPLIARKEALGVLGFFTKSEHQFGDGEIEFLQTLAGQAAVAIYNAQLYEQTKRHAEDLVKANKIKDEFLSVMSHELRTPLNVVLGYTAMLQEGILGEINPKQSDACVKITRRAQDLLNMVNSILYTTSIEAQAVRVERQEVQLSELLNEVRSGHEATLEKNLALVWDFPAELPVIRTDAAKIKQILQNLIHNAVKFTETGSVTISARIQQGFDPPGKAQNPTWLEFKVRDTGIGISQGALPTIFDKFMQVDSSDTRLYGGVGLGLYIVKKFTEFLGGTIDAESEPGRGSTFTVRIPCRID